MPLGRDLGLAVTQQVSVLVNFNDTNVGSTNGILFATLPAGAVVLSAFAKVITAFNAATTNVLTVGTNGTADNLLGAAAITEGTPGDYVNSTPGLAIPTADAPVYVKYTQTGTAATTGQAQIIVSYTVPR
jgi:hypothetical protein